MTHTGIIAINCRTESKCVEKNVATECQCLVNNNNNNITTSHVIWLYPD